MSTAPSSAAGRGDRPVGGRGDKPAAWFGLRPHTLLALVAIAGLIVPLSALSQPADSVTEGGLLARQRKQSGLSQANLGEIDPASETMRFACLGAKCIAGTLLWDRLNEYRKVEDWTSFSATLEQIKRLYPNFYSVWDFQAHNVSYNISVEFDDYHDRYAWVMKGIEFLREGAALNRFEPRLLNRMGWFLGQKIGRSDEKKQYRRLFKADDEFHERDRPGRSPAERDNWRVAHEKFRAAVDLADSGAPLRTTALIFHSEPMMSMINYAQALEEEGEFGETARDAWKLAREQMVEYAKREIPTTWDVPIQLGRREAELETAERIKERLEALLPGRFKAEEERRMQALPPEQAAALAVPLAERTSAQHELAAKATPAVRVTWKDVARDAPPELRDEALRLVEDLTKAEEMAQIIQRYREIVNFDFWRATCESEVTPDALKVRERLYTGQRELAAARLQTAKQAYEEAFETWRRVIDSQPVLQDNVLTADDVKDAVKRYRKVLEQLDEPFPKPFILQDLLDKAPPG